MKRKTRKLRKAKASESFYHRMNKQWLATTTIPPTESRVTQTYFIQEDINRELSSIIQKEERSGGPIAEFLQSWRTTEGRIPVGITSLTQLMLTMNTNSDIASRIGWMNRYGITPPLAVYIQGDPRNHKRCCVFLEEGEPQIGSPDFWSNGQGHRKAYRTYVHELATILGIPSIEMGFAAEREFASVFPSVTERRTRFHMLSWAELRREYRSIDWVALFTAWGLDESVLPRLVFNVTSSAFLHHLQNRIVRWSLPKWQGWFTLIAAQWIASRSPHGPLREAWFKYNCTFLQGVTQDQSTDKLRDAVLQVLMPNTLGRLWVSQYCDPHLPATVATMISHIRTGAIESLRKTSWMTLKTREAAIRKLRTMDVQVGWPDMKSWKPKEIACTLNSLSLIENLLSLSKLDTDENQALLVHGDCRHPKGKGWAQPVFLANAYYFPDENRFLLPAAILRPPFYDPRKSLAWNYGAIGATIGHEFCHAFDSDGRLYDEHGDKRDWWTDTDDREYKHRSQQVVKLFSGTKYKGQAVDGDLTLIENIADLGGLEFALAGLKDATTPSKQSLREFFEAFAVSWRSLERIERAKQLLVTDMHAPPELRVDLVVRQMDEWYEAYDVDPTSAEFVAPERRIHFFA